MFLKVLVLFSCAINITTIAQTITERMNLNELVAEVFGTDADLTPGTTSQCGFRNAEGVGTRIMLQEETIFGQ